MTGPARGISPNTINQDVNSIPLTRGWFSSFLGSPQFHVSCWTIHRSEETNRTRFSCRGRCTPGLGEPQSADRSFDPESSPKNLAVSTPFSRYSAYQHHHKGD